MKRRLIVSRENDVRESEWYLIQNDDGALFVEQRAKYRDGESHQRMVPINEFMGESGPPPRALQALIDRMFGDG